MQPNRLYRATVKELEGVLPPRVVSRALQEGLGHVDRDPSTVGLRDLDEILKGVVFRHLQATNPVDQARSIVASLMERLRSAEAEATSAPAVSVAAAPVVPVVPAPDPPEPSGPEAERLDALREALRPFNLYFDWPEVRKLRAQAQAIQQEIAAGVDVEASFGEAEAQLRLVEQKLEDQLVLQARDLADLEEAFEAVQTLGGPRVRRLEALVGQVRLAQADRTLADAEIERGRKLARDLRKLMESNVFSADDPPDTAIPGRRRRGDIAARVPPSTDPSAGDAAAAPADDGPADVDDDLRIAPEGLSPEITERLLQLDLEAEGKELDALLQEHDELLRYLPAIHEQFAALRARLAAHTSVSDDLAALRTALAETASGQRSNLEHELDAVARDVATLHPAVEAVALERALRVTRDVLAEGLPSYADVSAIRDLHRSARERSEEVLRHEADTRSRTAAQVEAQSELLERLDAALSRRGYGAEGSAALRQELREARDELAAAVAARVADTDALERSRRVETRWERALAEQADDARERLLARLRSDDARLSAMPELGSIRARAADLRDEVARLVDQADLQEAHVAALGSLVDRLHEDAIAETERRLDALGKEAGESVGEAVLRELQGAARSLAAGDFPDLPHLRVVIDQERARCRDRDQARLQRLQLEAVRLDASGVPSVERLRNALATARSELEEGRPGTRHLDTADTALVEIEAQMRERLRAFEGRLDTALAGFADVERLNNDDVATARRILTHLDSQRGAIARVSPGLQHQLVASLAEAEALLHDLGEAYEATRAIADQIVSGSMLDQVLGFFDEAADARREADEVAAAAEEVPDGEPVGEDGRRRP
jgi:chromosome segregation protein